MRVAAAESLYPPPSPPPPESTADQGGCPAGAAQDWQQPAAAAAAYGECPAAGSAYERCQQMEWGDGSSYHSPMPHQAQHALGAGQYGPQTYPGYQGYQDQMPHQAQHAAVHYEGYQMEYQMERSDGSSYQTQSQTYPGYEGGAQQLPPGAQHMQQQSTAQPAPYQRVPALGAHPAHKHELQDVGATVSAGLYHCPLCHTLLSAQQAVYKCRICRIGACHDCMLSYLLPPMLGGGDRSPPPSRPESRPEVPPSRPEARSNRKRLRRNDRAAAGRRESAAAEAAVHETDGCVVERNWEVIQQMASAPAYLRDALQGQSERCGMPPDQAIFPVPQQT